MQRTVWTPEGDQLQSTRVARLMARLGHPIDDSDPAPSIAAFIRWSQRQPDLFWGGVMDDLGVVWSQRYEMFAISPAAPSGPTGSSVEGPASLSTRSTFPPPNAPIDSLSSPRPRMAM